MTTETYTALTVKAEKKHPGDIIRQTGESAEEEQRS